jgi:hypothetical protein
MILMLIQIVEFMRASPPCNLPDGAYGEWSDTGAGWAVPLVAPAMRFPVVTKVTTAKAKQAELPLCSECYKPLSKGLLWIWGSGPQYFQTTTYTESTCYQGAQEYMKEKKSSGKQKLPTIPNSSGL